MCYPSWWNETSGIVQIRFSNGNHGTGVLLNNTSRDGRPYILTAVHCINTKQHNNVISSAEQAYVDNATFNCQYKAECDETRSMPYVTYNGSYYRAAWVNTDFLLVELKDAITFNNTIQYLGWDRNDNRFSPDLYVQSDGIGIHHPGYSLMKIAYDYDSPINHNKNLSWKDEQNYEVINPANTHWKAVFDNGMVGVGSSGSPLFDSQHHVVGQLHGGSGECGSHTTYYGKLSKSWEGGGTPNTRLKDWLDPINTNASILNRSTCNIDLINKTITDVVNIVACETTIENTTVENGANLSVVTGTNIRILPGFHAKAGSNMHLKVLNSSNHANGSAPFLARSSNGFSDNAPENNPSENIPTATSLTDKLLDNNGTNAQLYQNVPNPVQGSSYIAFYLPSDVARANIQITDLTGVTVKDIPLQQRGDGKINIEASALQKGLYIYSLIIDGRVTGTKRMMVL
jgi:V8-like Glu-specific endopeptidase